MIFPKAAVFKTLLGLAAMGGGYVGIYYTSDFYFNVKTSYDQALMNFLEDGGNINFKVTHKSGDGGSETEISNNFPKFENSKKTITVSIKVSTADSSGTGTITEATGNRKGRATKEHLKKANNGNDWTWICKIIFDKGGATETELETITKDKIFKTQNEGFLGNLKGGDKKEKKIEFIQKCAKHRGWSKNKEINLGEKTANKEITGKDIKIDLVARENKLFLKNQSDMEYWISRE